MRLTSRVEALEQADSPEHGGYASVWLPRDQSRADAVKAWESEHGPVGRRQVVFWNYPGKASDLQCA